MDIGFMDFIFTFLCCCQRSSNIIALKKIDHGWKKARECLTWSTCKQHTYMQMVLVLYANWMHTHTKKGIWIKTTVGAARSAIDDVSGVFIAPLIAVTASPANSHCTSYLSQRLQKISSHSHVHEAPLSTTVATCGNIEGLSVGGSELRSTVV